MTTAVPTWRTVLHRFLAGHPRGFLPADEYGATRRTQSTDGQVGMNLGTDQFLMVADTH